MSSYLEEAASLLRKAAATNEESLPSHERRCEIARDFAMLAAIDRGLLPASLTQDILSALAARHG
ncbi:MULTISPECIES: hypothetical protein [Streptomyces]|uniref:Uncharacterized protein n=2 Tax=Streptomyces TaxID=1883 RepID=A0A380MMB2_STRGR|nr:MULTISPECIES: hypothetical protein [Streptomyces]MBL3805589.1 hypothetical protein [Streptomyces sp. BRB081]PJM81829.1 hypothetical protein CH313_21035 [Streptomyces sp. TSRI0384-2]QNE82732.1 hypothetical protein F0345_17765 [Streptomyces rutgersensis]SUO92881.1 Uncharacterised protein [Streptomyces griseus]